MPEMIDQARAVLTRKCPHCEAGMGTSCAPGFHFDGSTNPPKCQKPRIDPAARDALLLALLEEHEAQGRYEEALYAPDTMPTAGDPQSSALQRYKLLFKAKRKAHAALAAFLEACR